MQPLIGLCVSAFPFFPSSFLLLPSHPTTRFRKSAANRLFLQSSDHRPPVRKKGGNWPLAMRPSGASASKIPPPSHPACMGIDRRRLMSCADSSPFPSLFALYFYANDKYGIYCDPALVAYAKILNLEVLLVFFSSSVHGRGRFVSGGGNRATLRNGSILSFTLQFPFCLPLLRSTHSTCQGPLPQSQR